MKRIKQMIAVVLALSLFTTLCACSGKDTSANTSAAAVATAEPESTAAAAGEKADELLKGMTVEEKVGQMFYVRCPDINAQDWVQTYHLGGYILFGRDFADKTADEIKTDIKSYQSKAQIPLLIGVDEEGGDVVRISDNPNLRTEAFPSPKEVWQNGGWEAIDSTEAEKADLLLSLGVNVNMAPVCDVTANTDSFMYSRSFSGNADDVCSFVTKTVSVCRQKKLGTVLKHFPGYGDNTDTHDDMAYDEKSLDEFRRVDFLPFKSGIAAGADCVLVAHIIVAAVDGEMPASLSEKVHKLIRDDLSFDGVIMTDDLVMEAVSKYTGAEAAAVTAVKCGNDILCCSDVETQYPAVLAAVKSGEISEEQVNASVKRILKWKQNLGLV